MDNDRIKVLYIMGWGRSGSTVLSMILGQIKDFFSAGEMNQVWKSGFLDNEMCGCGKPFNACVIWQAVYAEVCGASGSVDPDLMMHYLDTYVRTKDIPHLTLSDDRIYAQDFADTLSSLYLAIRNVTGKNVIVDSSKHPVYGEVLKSLKSIDLYILHLVRDPRAVAFSWQRRKQINIGDGKLFRRKSPLGSSLKWIVWNLGCHLLRRKMKERYLRIRYEDFTKHPQTVLSNILQFVGEKNVAIPLRDEYEIEITLNHTLAGNPVRFQQGKLSLKADTEWKSKLKMGDKILITLLTWPMLIKYGYL